MPNLPPVEGARSQLLTCDAVETVLVDRETLEELNWALVQALDGLENCDLWQEFVSAAERCLKEMTETQRTEEWERPIKSAMLFIEAWSDKSPDVLSLSTHQISEAYRVLHLILAASQMGDE